jgi:hypothetical protein
MKVFDWLIQVVEIFFHGYGNEPATDDGEIITKPIFKPLNQ